MDLKKKVAEIAYLACRYAVNKILFPRSRVFPPVIFLLLENVADGRLADAVISVAGVFPLSYYGLAVNFLGNFFCQKGMQSVTLDQSMNQSINVIVICEAWLPNCPSQRLMFKT